MKSSKSLKARKNKVGKKSEELLSSDQPKKMKKSKKESTLSDTDFIKLKTKKQDAKKKKMEDDEPEQSLQIEEPTRKRQRNNSEARESEIIRIKPKHRHSEKKKVVAQLVELQNVLKTNVPPNEEELELENLVFEGTVEDLFEKSEETVESEMNKKTELKPAWEDEDDETTLVKEKAETLRNCHRSIYLQGEDKYVNLAQEKFIKLMGAPKWADLNKEDEKMSDDESEDELLQKTGNFITKSESLPKGNIHAYKCPSLFDGGAKASLIKSVKFHPTSRVAMVASTNGTANLFQVDGKLNSKIQSIHFEDFPIQAAHFSPDGDKIFVGSNKYSHFYSYDMYSGKISKILWQKGMEQTNVRKFQLSPDGKFIIVHGRFGNIHLMTYKSREWIGSLKMNGEVNAITFNSDGSKMFSHGENSEVYIWDMAARRCIHKFVDEGCVTGTALSISPNDQFLAAGSDSGVVNIYDCQRALSTYSPQPLKAVLNLTTEITSLKFNSTSELLCMASCYKPEAVKLVHFPSLTVFSNFPPRGERHNLRYPNSLDISTNSGYLCIGNNVGTAHMYRLKHFKNY